MKRYLRHCLTGVALLVLLPFSAMAADNDSSVRSSEFVKVQNLAQPSQVELAMWDFAVTSGDPVEIKRFLDLYPDSQFAEDANVLLRALAPAEVADENADTVPKPDSAADAIVFGQPTITNPNTNETVSLENLISGSPLYPPIEGLPDEYWKNQTCSNCHAWEKDNLCTQGQFYVSQDADSGERVTHPYGGFFKDALKAWASNECP